MTEPLAAPLPPVERVAVVGAGAWGTTLATLLVQRGVFVTLITHRSEHAHAMQQERENRRYLPGFALPRALHVTSDVGAVSEADLILLVVPTAATQEAASAIHTLLKQAGHGSDKQAALVCCAKGLVPGSAQRVSDVVLAAGFDAEQVAVLSGPNLAREIAGGLPASAVVASASTATAMRAQAAIGSSRFRVYSATDVVGVELGGALKNVIAIAAGAVDGLALGQNAKAALIARGLAEMTRIGVAAGADAATFAGLSGLGDLVATCESPLSRNRTFGERLAGGLSVAESLAASGHVVEGVATAPVMRALGQRLGVHTPIADVVCAVLDGQLTVAGAMQALLERESRPEADAQARSVH